MRPAVPPRPARARRIRIWTALHTWTSLISTLFLLMLCLTGLPLIFHEEIGAMTGDEVAPPAMAPGTPDLPLDRLVEAVRLRRPGETIQFVGFDRDAPARALVATAPRADSPADEVRFTALDRRTAEILEEPKPREGLIAFLLKLHTDLFLGLPGKLFLGAMGFVMILAVVSGIAVYAPVLGTRAFGSVRRGRSRRIRWIDLHNLIGVTTLAWALLVSTTGMINTWADLMLGLWQRGQLAEMTASYREAPPPRSLASLDAGLATARVAAPGMAPSFIAYPGTRFSSRHHYAVFLRGETAVTSRLLLPVLIDAETGALTESRPLPWYLQALLLSQPLHFGDYGGLPLKLLWAVLDIATIVVLASGLYLWAARLRQAAAARRRVPPRGPVAQGSPAE